MNIAAWSTRTADSVMRRHPVLWETWGYEWGVVLKGIEQIWRKTGDARYFNYIKANIDHFVLPNGSIKTYQVEEYNLDQINTGKLLFPLYEKTGEEKYKQAIYLLRKQLATQPRTSEGRCHTSANP